MIQWFIFHGSISTNRSDLIKRAFDLSSVIALVSSEVRFKIRNVFLFYFRLDIKKLPISHSVMTRRLWTWEGIKWLILKFEY